MKSICFYFQVHQPYRLRHYRFFDIGNDSHYYDDYQNRYIMQRVAKKCYLPMNNLLLDLIREYGEKFKVSFSISGVALEQFKNYVPEVLESFVKLAETGSVEFLAETYSHSLSALKNEEEFRFQVAQQQQILYDLIGCKSKTFRNTELIYSDEIGRMVYDMGYETMLTEGAKHIIGWRSPNFLYCNAINPKLKLLLKNFQLSDDIAFRFSTQSWNGWPLTVEKYVDWLNEISSKEEIVNLFMDYETFGEHQWEETGIFDFMKALPKRIFSNSNFEFNTPSEVAAKYQPVSAIHVPYPISWADEERDLSAWLGNDLQNDAFNTLYALKNNVNKINDTQITNDWLKLQTSDHFYYMCTKWFSDGDVHKYFNPYGTPYDAYINFMNVISDFALRISKKMNISEVAIVNDNISENIIHLKPENISEKTIQIVEKSEKNNNRKKPQNYNVLTIRKILTMLTSEEAYVLYMSVDKNERKKIEKYIGKKKWKDIVIKKESKQKVAQKVKQEMKNRYKKMLSECLETQK